jgi:short-subunit dehydrogenase involved in D-alanine esterification of teichoic acids
VLGFVPLALTAVYSATKAAVHSYALSQRFMLRDAGVKVLEIAPPWVRTDLMNSREAEQAMPLDDFIAGTMALLGTDADEIILEGDASDACERRPRRARFRHRFQHADGGAFLGLIPAHNARGTSMVVDALSGTVLAAQAQGE